MVDQFHEFELPVGPFGMSHILERARQLLDGHILLGHGVIGSAEIEHKKEIRNMTCAELTLTCQIMTDFRYVHNRH